MQWNFGSFEELEIMTIPLPKFTIKTLYHDKSGQLTDMTIEERHEVEVTSLEPGQEAILLKTNKQDWDILGKFCEYIRETVPNPCKPDHVYDQVITHAPFYFEMHSRQITSPH